MQRYLRDVDKLTANPARELGVVEELHAKLLALETRLRRRSYE